MEEKQELETTVTEEEVSVGAETAVSAEDTETPLDKNVRLLSPTRMVLRRFFRSKLSVVGLIMLIISHAIKKRQKKAMAQMNQMPQQA